MPESTLETLLATAAFIGFIHTATGPDHFLPFIALSQAGNWSLRKTMLVTTACGIGHVASSVLLGLAGLAIGAAVAGLTNIEEFRGSIAGWLLLSFGLAYLVWGLRRAWRSRPHAHVHAHADGTIHFHKHTHDTEHAHVHAAAEKSSVVTPWIVFLIFVFGPCEPLIPLLMYPAAEASLAGSVLVAVVFGVATLSTMLVMVTIGYLGLVRFARGTMERYGHAACGGAIALCGAAVVIGL
ncbi:MAG: sulfite exporter TauE/SafE family protein [Pirellulales bacterium]